MKSALLTLSAALLGSTLLATGSVSAEDRAVIVGINKYAFLKDADLNAARGDALKFRDFVRSHMGFDDSQITMLLDGDASRENVIKSLVADLKFRTKPGDRFVFYFSGHGAQTKDRDGDENDGKDEYIVLADRGSKDSPGVLLDDEMRYLFELFADRRILVVVDSCYSGTISRDLGVSEDELGRTVLIETGDESVPLHPDIASLGPLPKLEATRSATVIPGQKHMDVWSAVSQKEVALENKYGGVFTRLFLEGLGQGKADRNKNGRVSNAELLAYVRGGSAAYCRRSKLCQSKNNGRLTPEFGGSIQKVAALTAPAPAPAVVAAPAPAAPATSAPASAPAASTAPNPSPAPAPVAQTVPAPVAPATSAQQPQPQATTTPTQPTETATPAPAAAAPAAGTAQPATTVSTAPPQTAPAPQAAPSGGAATTVQTVPAQTGNVETTAPQSSGVPIASAPVITPDPSEPGSATPATTPSVSTSPAATSPGPIVGDPPATPTAPTSGDPAATAPEPEPAAPTVQAQSGPEPTPPVSDPAITAPPSPQPPVVSVAEPEPFTCETLALPTGTAILSDLFLPSGNDAVQLSINPGATLAIGDTVLFDVEADRNGQIILFDLNPDCELFQIFPSQLSPNDAEVLGNKRRLTIPNAMSVNGQPLEIQVTEPYGRGHLLAVLVEDDVQTVTALLPDHVDLDPIPAGLDHLVELADALNMSLNDDVGVRPSRWHAAIVPYNILP
jgi:hypothetical protein